MKPVKHLIASISIAAAIYHYTHSLYASLVCIFFGVFPDSDHIIEYIIHYGYNSFTLKKCYTACEQTNKQKGDYQFKKIYFLFHSNEAAFLLCALALYTKNMYLFAAVLGYLMHLILDYIGNPAHPGTYFVIWRAKNKFYTQRVLRRR
ncbi:MAG: hypothetical protein ABIC18_03055 [Candidatus Omnitrophota bacterium]